MTVGELLAFDGGKFKEVPQSRAVLVLWGILGLEQMDSTKEELLSELNDRKAERERMENSFKSMKVTSGPFLEHCDV